MKEEDFVNKVLSAKTAQGKGVMFQIPDLSQEIIGYKLTFVALSNIEDCEFCITWRFMKTEVVFCNYSADFQVISTSHPCFLGGRESLIFQTYL